MYSVSYSDGVMPCVFQAGEREQVIVGRVVVALLVGVSLCWLPIIQGIINFNTMVSDADGSFSSCLGNHNTYMYICYVLLFPGSAGTQLFVYIQTVQSYLAPPITMVFGLGILWTGLTASGALSGLVIGFIMGMAKFIVGNVFPAPSCGKEDDRPGFAKMHFMFYGK